MFCRTSCPAASLMISLIFLRWISRLVLMKSPTTKSMIGFFSEMVLRIVLRCFS